MFARRDKAKSRIEAVYECEENKAIFNSNQADLIAQETRVMEAYCKALSISSNFRCELKADNCFLVRVVSYHDVTDFDEALLEHNRYLEESEFFMDFKLIDSKFEVIQ